MIIIYMIIIFILFKAYRNLLTTGSGNKANIILGFLNVIQWLIALAFPIALVTFLALQNVI